MSEQFSPMQFKVGEYYTGKCDEVRVAKMGEALTMQFGFTIGPDFRDYTKVFLGSDAVGKDGLTNDQRCQRDLVEFGCDSSLMETDDVMAHIRSVMIGKEIQVQSGEYKGNVQFSGCRVPGRISGPNIVETKNPFGSKRAAPPSGGSVF